MNQGHSQSISLVSADVNLMVGNVTQDKNETLMSVTLRIKTQQDITHLKKNLPWNLVSKCACEGDKDCEIGEYLKKYQRIKIPNDDLVVICDGIGDTLESIVINPSHGMGYWLIAVVLSAITCLLFLVANVVTDIMKLGLAILCLLSY